MSLTVIVALVWTHFLADFILQTDKVAIAKSGDNVVLTEHVAIYMLPFWWLAVLMPTNEMLAWWSINFIGHWLTDYVSSRICSRLYKADERHWFFVVIGADQAIHLTTLFATFAWLA